MSTHKNIDKICIAILIFAVALTAVFVNADKFGVQVVVDEDAETYSDSIYFTANDLDGNWDTSDATQITLNGDDCEIAGDGVYSYDGNVVIATTGKYVVSGTLDDGSIIVDAYDASKVWIMLNGVSVNRSDDAAFRVDQADKVFLTMAEGTENTFTSGEEYSDEALDDGTDGAIFAHDDLTINGSGSLYVVANYRHGIEANDDLVITGGTIAVDAPEDAININNNFRMRDAYVTLACDDDGLVVKKEDDGYLYMESGTLDITSGDDGIHTAGDVTIDGGDLTIVAGDDGIHSDTAVAVSDGTILISECYEGIEAITIDITGGDITVYPTDDGINANGGSGDMMGGFGGGQGGMGGGHGGPPDMNRDENGSGNGDASTDAENASGSQNDNGIAVTNGEENSANNDTDNGNARNDVNDGAVSSDNADNNGNNQPPQMPDGNFGKNGNDSENGDASTDTDNASGSQNGNGNVVTNGDENYADNTGNGNAKNDVSDGVSAFSNNTENNEITNENSDTDEDEETYVKITDGTITIINETGQDADGIDSNGDILITGGTIRVSLPGDGSNNALDYGSESGGICKIDGGNVIACGGSAMLEEISATSEQCSIMYNTEETVVAGTTAGLQDADGNVLLSYDVPCSYSSVVLSCADMQLNQTYQVLANGEVAEEVTLEETATTVGTSQNNMRGGIGGHGGMGGGPNGGMGGRGGWQQMQQDDDQMDDTNQQNGDGQQGSDTQQNDNAQQGNDNSQSNAGQSSTDENTATTSDSEPSSATIDGQEMQRPMGDTVTSSATDEANNMPMSDVNGGPPDFGGEAGATEENAEEETAVDTRVDIRELDAESKAFLGASVVVLLAGLIFAKMYKRRRW